MRPLTALKVVVSCWASVVVKVPPVVETDGVAIMPRGKRLALLAVYTSPIVNVVLGVTAIAEPYQPKRLESRTPLIVSFNINML